MTGAKPQFLTPPKRIKDKVGSSGGVEPTVALARAASIVGDAAGDFAASSNTELIRLEAALARAQADNNPEQHRDALFGAAHEIRGQSGTFGYPLATAAGDAMCKFMAARQPMKPDDLQYLALYVQSVGAIFRNRLTDDGGAMGAELKALLARMAAKI